MSRRFIRLTAIAASAALVELVNSPDFFKNPGQQFVELAAGKLQSDSALVQGWESQTAFAQANRGNASMLEKRSFGTVANMANWRNAA